MLAQANLHLWELFVALCRCNGNTLGLLPAVNCPFTMTIYNPQVPSIDGFVVNACGGVFSAGDPSETCSYCPTDIVPDYPLGSETVLYSSGFMVSRKLDTNS